MTQARIWLPQGAKDYQELIELVKGQMSRWFGGYTVYEGVGGWEDDTGQLIEEDVSVVESYTSDSVSLSHNRIEGLAETLKDATEEDAIMFAINHDHVLVE